MCQSQAPCRHSPALPQVRENRLHCTSSSLHRSWDHHVVYVSCQTVKVNVGAQKAMNQMEHFCTMQLWEQHMQPSANASSRQQTETAAVAPSCIIERDQSRLLTSCQVRHHTLTLLPLHPPFLPRVAGEHEDTCLLWFDPHVLLQPNCHCWPCLVIRRGKTLLIISFVMLQRRPHSASQRPVSLAVQSLAC